MNTRLCLDPWAKVLIKSNRSVCICCYSPPVGHLDDSSLDEILDSAEATEYRAKLLSGEMKPACQICPDKNMVPVERLKEIVTRYVESGEKPFGIG